MKTSTNLFFHAPRTKLGKWTLVFGTIFVLMFAINILVFMPVADNAPWRQVALPLYGILMLLCGLGAGVTGTLSLIRDHERSWLVWLMLLPGLLVVFLLVGEIFFEH